MMYRHWSHMINISHHGIPKIGHWQRKEEREIIYRSVPNVRSAKLAKPHWLDPKTQKGTHPMTAIFEILRDVEHGKLCDQDVTLFDGARRVRIALSNPKESGTRAT